MCWGGAVGEGGREKKKRGGWEWRKTGGGIEIKSGDKKGKKGGREVGGGEGSGRLGGKWEVGREKEERGRKF